VGWDVVVVAPAVAAVAGVEQLLCARFVERLLFLFEAEARVVQHSRMPCAGMRKR